MDIELRSGGLRLAAHVAEPPASSLRPPAVVLAHGFPHGALGAAAAGASFPMLADRVANEGWLALTFSFRGCGTSEGDFSLAGWLDDLTAAIDLLQTMRDNRGVWLAGFGTGGALCVSAGARRPEVRGVAALGAPADFDDWSNHPRRLLQHAREIGAIRDPAFPPAMDAWAREPREIRPVTDAKALADRPFLVLHGSEDESVPSFDARVLGDAHGDAELRIIGGAAHDLRHDPRAIAILLGWFDRERHRSE